MLNNIYPHISKLLEEHSLESIQQKMETVHYSEIESAIYCGTPLTLNQFIALISPRAIAYLDQISTRAQQLTAQRFGKTILMYSPLYLSNACENHCLYCGYNATEHFERVTLTIEQILTEARILKDRGFMHILLLTGEDPASCPIEYLELVIHTLKPLFSSISLEIYPLAESNYHRLVLAGADSLTIYQETYNRSVYAHVHPHGSKSDYAWRLATPDRACSAGFRRINIGALLGLSDWRFDAVCLAVHARYLIRQFWRTQISISFPRLSNAPEYFSVPNSVSDTNLKQIIMAMRLFFPDSGLVLSTREDAMLRDSLIGVGITQMSAGSTTNPQGYTNPESSVSQFKVVDQRTTEEVTKAIQEAGYTPVWKDWEAIMR